MRAVALALYRVRGLLYYVAAAILISSALLGFLFPVEVRRVLGVVAIVVVALCLALIVLGPRLLPERSPTPVMPPVRGRWLAANSPASAVPSHGVRMYGQAYAIDLVYDPTDAERPTSRAMNPPDAYPAFGRPVYSMVDGVVVSASGWRRDHRSRSTALAMLYLMAEGAIREIGGPGFIIGNHVTVRSGDGIFATVAHLQRGSLTVKVGDTVEKGDQLGLCGNSGNSTEPHVHAQLMDRRSPWTAQGLPFELTKGVPVNGEHLEA